jgi:hypothetical protein
MNAKHTIPPLSTVRVNEARALASVRSQAAFVRSLLDEVERIAPAGAHGPVSAQLVEELARLGCRFIEVASALTTVADANARDAGGLVTKCA